MVQKELQVHLHSPIGELNASTEQFFDIGKLALHVGEFDMSELTPDDKLRRLVEAGDTQQLADYWVEENIRGVQEFLEDPHQTEKIIHLPTLDDFGRSIETGFRELLPTVVSSSTGQDFSIPDLIGNVTTDSRRSFEEIGGGLHVRYDLTMQTVENPNGTISESPDHVVIGATYELYKLGH